MLRLNLILLLLAVACGIGTVASNHRIESIARNKLHMKAPLPTQVISIEASPPVSRETGK